MAIGGGTGLSSLLRGLKTYTSNLSAIVTVADDGGSSGRLRDEYRILPPGDFRQCLIALADAEPLMKQLFDHRFKEGSLDGHAFGNLFIMAMADITGNFEQALRESGKVLAVKGTILPSTLRDVTLVASINGSTVEGESKIPKQNSPISHVFLKPDGVQVNPEAAQAILSAELIIVGPGSLYTSILPNLLVEGMVEAIKASAALKLYICNLAAQPGDPVLAAGEAALLQGAPEFHGAVGGAALLMHGLEVDEQAAILPSVATLRPLPPRIVAAAREAQDPAEAPHRIHPGLLTHEGRPHSDSRAKKATAFFRMSRSCVTCASARFTRVSSSSAARRGPEPRNARVRPLPFSCVAHLYSWLRRMPSSRASCSSSADQSAICEALNIRPKNNLN